MVFSTCPALNAATSDIHSNFLLFLFQPTSNTVAGTIKFRMPCLLAAESSHLMRNITDTLGRDTQALKNSKVTTGHAASLLGFTQTVVLETVPV